MTQLSILICSLPEPYNIEKLRRLEGILRPQIEGRDIELLIDSSDRRTPTGTKRNNLFAKAQGEYIQFVDDDDVPTESFIKDILWGLQGSPDCVTFRGWMTTNGANRREFTIKLGSQYHERDGHYYRWPNHLAVMRKSLVQHIKFPDIWITEDYIWSKAVNDQRVLKTEYHIDKPIYHYDYWDNKPHQTNVRITRLR